MSVKLTTIWTVISMLALPVLTTGNFVKYDERTSWWKHTLLYEVLLPSFKDSNGDGIGDINGVISKMDHFQEMNIGTLWLTPFTKTPFKAIGYDISNFTEVDPLFGTMENFELLMFELKKRGMRLIFDLIINHTSDEHPWFVKSVNKEDPYTDYYVWKDAKGYNDEKEPIPPNNWTGLFNGQGMWEWSEKRKQFYLHQFVEYMPDLNLRNPDVVREFHEIMKFWISKGVDGFRLDAIPHYLEDDQFRDEPLKNPDQKGYIDWIDFDHIHTFNHPDSFKFIHELRLFLDEAFNKDGISDKKIFVGESVQNRSMNINYYGNLSYPITHYSFAFELELIEHIPTSSYLDHVITNWLRDVKEIDSAINWVTETHDRPRIPNRMFEEMGDMLVILSMMVPGACTIYYGQEIGHTGKYLRTEFKSDMFVTERLPMPWDDSRQGGFTTNATSWLPVNPNYWSVNLRNQRRDKNSKFNMFKMLSLLRKDNVLIFGDYKSYVISETLYCFTRKIPGKPNYVIVLFNFNIITEYVNLKKIIYDLPLRLHVATSSVNTGLNNIPSFVTQPSDRIEMRPISSIVFTTGPVKRFSKSLNNNYDLFSNDDYE